MFYNGPPSYKDGPKNILTARGWVKSDITRSQVSHSTGVRRDRINKKDVTSTKPQSSRSDVLDWRKHTDEETEIRKSKKNESRIRNLIIKPIQPDNKILTPHMAVHIVPILMTPDEGQEFIDYCNNKQFVDTDPHKCSKYKPCKLISGRKMKKDGVMVPDYRAGSHMCLIDTDILTNREKRFVKNKKKPPIIIPSWHSDILDKWWTNYYNDKTTTACPFPIDPFDVILCSDTNIKDKFNSLKKNQEKQLYIIANIFPGDANPDEEHNYDVSIQLPRGKVDSEDMIRAGYTPKIKQLTDKLAYKIGLYAAIRESMEESDWVLCPPPVHSYDKIFSVKDDSSIFGLYGDYQHGDKDSKKVYRAIVIGANKPLDPYEWIDDTRIKKI